MIDVFLAEGFEEIEALAVVDILRRAGHTVRMVAVGVPHKQVAGAHGIVVEADVLEQGLTFSETQAIVLPGGMPGTTNLEASPVVREAVLSSVREGKWVAAICAAPSILGHLGVLQGKRAVCYPGFEADLTGAQVQDSMVCQDGKLITGKGPGAAIEFGLKLAACLSGEGLAEQLRVAMQCQPC